MMSVKNESGENPVVSVIVPTHNRPDLLVGALRSILNQTFDHFEIVVVNDAGSDVEPAVASLNAGNRIVCVRHETNKGLAAARNTGIRSARGRYIAYLDDDDLYHPDHLKTLVEFLSAHPGTVAYTDAYRACMDKTSSGWVVTQRETAYSQHWDNDAILVDNFVPVLCFMHEKAFLEKSGWFDESLKRHEDWDLWIRLSRHFSFVHIPKVTCEFALRNDGKSMTGQSFAQFHETMTRIHAKYAAFTGRRSDLLAAQEAKEEELRSLSEAPHRIPKFKAGVLTVDDKLTACAVLRLVAPLNFLHARRRIQHLPLCEVSGNQIKIDPNSLRQAQVIAVQRGVAGYVPYPVLRAAIDPSVKIVFELDDALTMLPKSHQFFDFFQTISPKMEEYLRHADMVTVSTPKLKELYSYFSDNIVVLPNTIDAKTWLPMAKKQRSDSKVSILFSGTLTHQHDLALIEAAIERIIREYPEKVEFLFWGNAPASLRSYSQIKAVSQFTSDYAAYAQALKSLAVDLAIVPLEISPFNQAKSAIKWLEYSACGIPAIFTDTAAYSEFVEHGRTGWLVANTTEAWHDAMKTLIEDAELRRNIAENAQRTVVQKHTLDKNVLLWEDAYERVLALPAKKLHHKERLASIVIPTFNNLSLTRQCLDAIYANTPQGLYEIVVVDNGSTDGTPSFLMQEQATGRIRAYLNPQNRGFAQACNQGAMASNCPWLVFLNNDTAVKSGWLQALLKAAERPGTGVVGAKLLYPDGRVQHAGIEFINGVPDHPFRFANADAPEVNAARELDMVTGACFLLPQVLFHRLAGFDESFKNGVEDVDLCLRVRSAGLTVYYEPQAVVTHYEGQSVGRFQHVNDNLRLFFQRWTGQFNERMRFAPPPAPKAIRSAQSILLNRGAVRAAWEGTFLDFGSLSHVNRELAGELSLDPRIQLVRVAKNGAESASSAPGAAFALKQAVPGDTQVVVRHQWPPDWNVPACGAFVSVQPWEFGALPAAWVSQLAKVDEIWAYSEYVKRVYIDSGVPADKVKVVPLGVNPKTFHPGLAPMELNTRKKFKFLFVGGTIPRKGPDVLLQAYLDTFSAADDVCLVIKDFGGKGVYAGQTIESRIRAAQSQPGAPEILYLNDELDSIGGLYAACDCLVHPYRGEGFGLPVLEAMACGLPVIVTAGGATDDFATDEYAYRVPATRKTLGEKVGDWQLVHAGWMLEPDVVQVGERMRWVYTHPQTAAELGRKAAGYVGEKWTWRRSAEIAAERLEMLAAKREVLASALAARRGRKLQKVELPPAAKVGHLGEARNRFERREFKAAWDAASKAITLRPHHPEACLLLAEIALAAGDSVSARKCAQRSRELAPAWRPPRKFLEANPKGNTRHEWLVIPEEIAKPESGRRLSVCLIVKNEEKFLAQCLQSIQGIACQIVVVDTGSTDRTMEIAHGFGAEVHPFPWCDDFSAARNAALEHARGDWILSLDADEEVTLENRELLLQEIGDSKVLAYRMPIIDKGLEEQGASYVPRLFRNAPGLFFVGRVHEQVFASLEARRSEWGLINALGKAALLHHGYSKELVAGRDKIRRNLLLLEKAVEEMPNEPSLLMNYGLELTRAGREQAGLEQYWEAYHVMAAQPDNELVPELREMLLTQLCTRLMAGNRFDDIVNVLSSPLAASGAMTASLHFAKGLACLHTKRFQEAEHEMRHCLAKRDQPALAPINPEIKKAGPSHCLALCLVEQKRHAEAEIALQSALKDAPQSAVVRFDLARLHADRGRMIEALQVLNALVTEYPGESSYWQFGSQIALSKPEYLDFGLDWTAEALKQVPDKGSIVMQRAEALTLGQLAAQALPLWSRLATSGAPAPTSALILCELAATGDVKSFPLPLEPRLEAAISQEFLKWYQRLIVFNAASLLGKINMHLSRLERLLPSACSRLKAALAEVR